MVCHFVTVVPKWFHSAAMPLTVDCVTSWREEVSQTDLLQRWQTARLGAWFYIPEAMGTKTPEFIFLRYFCSCDVFFQQLHVGIHQKATKQHKRGREVELNDPTSLRWSLADGCLFQV